MCNKDGFPTLSDSDIKVDDFISHDIPVHRVHVKTERAAKLLGRKCGQYIILNTGPLEMLIDFEKACDCLIEQLRPMLEPFYGKSLCICGIGNRDREVDSLGPETARRIRPNLCETFSFESVFEKVAVICPGVSGYTNLLSETVIAGVVSSMNASCILTIDSCKCGDIVNLCSTIQFNDTGMKSYWGTADIHLKSVGAPIVSIAMPTVISVDDILGSVKSSRADLFLSPTHVSNAIETAAFIISCAIYRIIYPNLDYEHCKQMIMFGLLGIM